MTLKPDQRPDTWRNDPTKTFFVGVAMGLTPLVIVMFVVMVLLPVPGCTP